MERNKNPVKENTLYAGEERQNYMMKKKIDGFLNLHSKQSVGEEPLSHKKAHLCSSSEEVKITAAEKRVIKSRL